MLVAECGTAAGAGDSSVLVQHMATRVLISHLSADLCLHLNPDQGERVVRNKLPLDMESSSESSHTRLNKEQLKAVAPCSGFRVCRILFTKCSVVV